MFQKKKAFYLLNGVQNIYFKKTFRLFFLFKSELGSVSVPSKKFFFFLKKSQKEVDLSIYRCFLLMQCFDWWWVFGVFSFARRIIIISRYPQKARKTKEKKKIHASK